MIADSDKGSDIDPFADQDNDEDQAKEKWASWLQSMCASVFTICPLLVFE